nr:unnamed protein product [Digitaria exilis]
MVNPSYYQTSPSVRSQVQHKEHVFHLYAHKLEDRNDHAIVTPPEGLPNSFGSTYVVGWDVRDGPDTSAMLVGEMQGLAIAASRTSLSWYISFNLVFTDERFKGSTLTVQGHLGPKTVGDEGAWVVAGGTGEFINAQGICTYKRIGATSEGFINELRIRVMCLTILKLVKVQKIGPWGGNGGAAYEINDGELPQRLESLSIYAEDFIQSIAFSYIDQTGQKRTVGPWGGDDGKSEYPLSPPIPHCRWSSPVAALFSRWSLPATALFLRWSLPATTPIPRGAHQSSPPPQAGARRSPPAVAPFLR